jgi:hypothetical protein
MDSIRQFNFDLTVEWFSLWGIRAERKGAKDLAIEQ